MIQPHRIRLGDEGGERRAGGCGAAGVEGMQRHGSRRGRSWGRGETAELGSRAATAAVDGGGVGSRRAALRGGEGGGVAGDRGRRRCVGARAVALREIEAGGLAGKMAGEADARRRK